MVFRVVLSSGSHAKIQIVAQTWNSLLIIYGQPSHVRYTMPYDIPVTSHYWHHWAEELVGGLLRRMRFSAEVANDYTEEHSLRFETIPKKNKLDRFWVLRPIYGNKISWETSKTVGSYRQEVFFIHAWILIRDNYLDLRNVYENIFRLKNIFGNKNYKCFIL